MSNDIQNKRAAIRKAYHGPKWQAKVDMMTDNQIIAVYLRLKRQAKV